MIRVDDVMALIDSNPGPAYHSIDKTTLKAFIDYELASNRWAMATDQDGKIMGWISWYGFDLASLLKIYELGLPKCFEEDIPLFPGKEIYICNAVILPKAPRGTFRKLWNMVVKANPSANSFNAHLRNRKNQKMRWFCKVVKR